MKYVFIEPASIVGLIVIFTSFLVLLIYLTYVFLKRAKLSSLRKASTAFIVGFPNSGRSFVVRELCKSSMGVFDKILNISHADLIHDGTVKLKILDHHGTFSRDGKVDRGAIKQLKNIDPKYIINVMDVSQFAEPIEQQIDFIKRVNKNFKSKKVFLVANKVGRKSGKNLRKIREEFGKNFYKIRMNKPKDIEKLRQDLIKFLKKM
jgi:GTP1/Obg family GTP-binding protein